MNISENKLQTNNMCCGGVKMYEYELTFVLKNENQRDKIDFFQKSSEIRSAERRFNENFQNAKRSKRINVVIQNNFLKIFLFSQNEIKKQHVPCCLQFFSQTLVEKYGFEKFCTGAPRRLFTNIKT